MKKITFFSLSILLYSCSHVHFDHPMPAQGNAIKDFQDLSGAYSFMDTTINAEGTTYYNSLFYEDAYKKRDSIKLVTAVVFFENKQMISKIHLKSYYKKNKVDTTSLIAAYQTAKKSSETNFIIFDEDVTDTVIDLGKQDQLKSYQGNYYLNKYQKENQWEVYQLSLREDLLYIGILNEQDSKDLTNYTIKRTKLVSVVHLEDDIFSKFVASGGFKTRLKFKKHGPTH